MKKPTPKKQQAHSQSSRRYKAFKRDAQKRLLAAANLVACPSCNEMKLSHAACPTCGKYSGRQAISMEKKMDKITKVKA